MELFPAKSELVDRAGTKVVDEDVGLGKQRRHELGARRRGQVHLHAALAPIEPDEMRRLTLDDRVPAPREVTIGRTLELDDVRAEVSQMARATRRRRRMLPRLDPNTR